MADSLERLYKGTGFSFEVGKEFRKIIAENFKIRYGLDLGFRFNKSVRVNKDLVNPSRDRDDTSNSYGPYFNIVLGFNYEIKESLIIGIEILPSVSYSKAKRIEYDVYSGNYNELELSSFSYGFSSNSARLTLAYRF